MFLSIQSCLIYYVLIWTVNELFIGLIMKAKNKLGLTHRGSTSLIIQVSTSFLLLS